MSARVYREDEDDQKIGLRRGCGGSLPRGAVRPIFHPSYPNYFGVNFLNPMLNIFVHDRQINPENTSTVFYITQKNITEFKPFTECPKLSKINPTSNTGVGKIPKYPYKMRDITLPPP